MLICGSVRLSAMYARILILRALLASAVEYRWGAADTVIEDVGNDRRVVGGHGAALAVDAACGLPCEVGGHRGLGKGGRGVDWLYATKLGRWVLIRVGV